MHPNKEELILKAFGILGACVHSNAKQKGFWEGDQHSGVYIAMMHSELSEALEALRADNPKSEKIPKFSLLEEELADAVIRILDFSAAKELKLAGAILAKHEYNQGRLYKHGKEF